MITFFTTGKPFTGHSGVIQRNALKSWTLLGTEVEVILFGEDQGAGETASELGIRHESHVERNEYGTKRLNYLFCRAQEIARHEVLCYLNCDIVLMEDFSLALQKVMQAHSDFLMIGRRRDTEITKPQNFENVSWQSLMRDEAMRHGKLRGAAWIDYFAFSRGLFPRNMPPFVVGRVFWDHWLVWRALDLQKPVVDATAMVTAVHQNHDYAYHPRGIQGVWSGLEAGENHKMAGGWNHLRTIGDATERLTAHGVRKNRKRYLTVCKRYVRQAGRKVFYDLCKPAWFLALTVTRPLRTALGMRSTALRRVRQRL
jgi:hypothetical protein